MLSICFALKIVHHAVQPRSQRSHRSQNLGVPPGRGTRLQTRPGTLLRGEFVDLQDGRIYCYASGSRGAGDPVILVHGAFTSSYLWRDLLPRLPDGYRVLVLDLLGHGRSDPPRQAEMSVEAHALRLTMLMDVMGVERAALVGHGMGAAIVLLVAQRHPSRVCKIGLINPEMPFPRTPGSTVNNRLTRLATLVHLWRHLAPQWLASALHGALVRSYHLRSAGARSLDVYLKVFRTREGLRTACAQLLALRAEMKQSKRARKSKSSAPIECAALLAAGAFDPLLTESEAERMGAELCQTNRPGQCAVHLMPGVAHYAPEEAPDRLGALLFQLLSREDNPSGS